MQCDPPEPGVRNRNSKVGTGSVCMYYLIKKKHKMVQRKLNLKNRVVHENVTSF